jgi:hypothetical protein
VKVPSSGSGSGFGSPRPIVYRKKRDPSIGHKSGHKSVRTLLLDSKWQNLPSISFSLFSHISIHDEVVECTPKPIQIFWVYPNTRYRKFVPIFCENQGFSIPCIYSFIEQRMHEWDVVVQLISFEQNIASNYD